MDTKDIFILKIVIIVNSFSDEERSASDKSTDCSKICSSLRYLQVLFASNQWYGLGVLLALLKTGCFA